ncbi:hypothetical protein Taro_007949 [Colocasia esculenta]|uniref:Uncharacterized protein n=1 Tax=Colocasia esculenta TaxID=4460 RepID=A0A843TZR1_COLES|nr:hypothetical protein [Colocasia esculenta]
MEHQRDEQTDQDNVKEVYLSTGPGYTQKFRFLKPSSQTDHGLSASVDSCKCTCRQMTET